MYDRYRFVYEFRLALMDQRALSGHLHSFMQTKGQSLFFFDIFVYFLRSLCMAYVKRLMQPIATIDDLIPTRHQENDNRSSQHIFFDIVCTHG